MSGSVLRIANASGFYGDRTSALVEQVEGGDIDVLTGDWLAELTSMILRRDQQRDPTLGWCRTFPEQIAPVLATCLERGIKIITNAGGLNPLALAEVVQELGENAGLAPRIAVLTGDDVSDQIRPWLDAGEALAHLDDGRSLAADGREVRGANAYLGCAGIVAALKRGADIVITGRVTDPSLVMGPAAWYFGWRPHHYDALAAALVAGHVLECGTQATGGNHSFWTETDPALPAFPIAEMRTDGSAVITVHPGAPGHVDVDTVRAQLLYEITGRDIVSPDVIARLDSVALLDAGPGRVRLIGVTGQPPRDTLKVAIELDAGWRNRIHLLISAPNAAAKAERVAHQFWRSVGGTDAFAEARTDRIGTAAGDTPATNACVVALSARDPDPDRVGRAWTRRATELALASVPGLSLLAPPARPKPCAALWPALVPRSRVPMALWIDGDRIEVPHPEVRPGPLPFDDELFDESTVNFQEPPTGHTQSIAVGRLCGARSGDKGGQATLGLWVRDPDHYGWLTEAVTTATVLTWLRETGFEGPITRTVLPNLSALLFVLDGYLGEGVGCSLRPDPQAKLLAEFVRSRQITVDTSILGDGG